MKTKWDYTKLADAYLKRPDYAISAVDEMISTAGIKKKNTLCDIGAGAAHLTIILAKYDLNIIAIEPNKAMRDNGIKRTLNFKNVSWCEGTGENTGQNQRFFEMVTFGSSFNVCDRKKALEETARILKPDGWFACMWNHRNLQDPIQSSIEKIIKNHVTNYGYGTRREDQTKIINESGLFKSVIHINSTVLHEQSITECIGAWKSHATLERQAGKSFNRVIDEIHNYLLKLSKKTIKIPYTTNIWMSQIK